MSAAALYIDPRGPYPKLLSAEACYDAQRDATQYLGSLHVVAHPPCGPWGHLRHLDRKGLAPLGLLAVWQVRLCGGVLEHPAHSKLWAACDLPYPYPRQGDPLPFAFCDEYGGYSVQVAQCDWGHVARKLTWLYIVGVPQSLVQALIEARPFPNATPTHWASGSRNAPRGPVPNGIKVCSAEQRRRTPEAFARMLITIAEAASSKGCAA